MKLSAIIIAKNEAENIVECIQSVNFANEVIVIDDNSSDNTAQLAATAGAIVYTRAMQGDFAAQRNYAIEKANSDWLLFIDCDERISDELAREIKQSINQKADTAYGISRLNHFARQPVFFGHLRSDVVIRLFPKQKVCFVGKVHERVEHGYPVKVLKHKMIHYTYQSWTQYYLKMEQYTRLSAKQYAETGRSISFIRDVLLKPFWSFLKMYIFRGGFIDGRLGWILAVNYSHYTFMKYSRLYSIRKIAEDTV